MISHSPVNAVKVGRELNTDQQKDNAKRSLFLTLYALRGTPLHYDFVRCLNQIDIVFEDNPTVLQAWRKHYDSLNTKGVVNPQDVWRLQRVEMLSAMAQVLGYSAISQADMSRDYYPEGHENQIRDSIEFQQAHLTYLKTGTAMHEQIVTVNKRQLEGSSQQTQ